MASSIYYSGAYCYLVRYEESLQEKYELFIAVPTEAGKTVTFNPSGDTLQLDHNTVEIEVVTLNSLGAPETKVTHRYSNINLGDDFDPDTAQLEIVIKASGRADWNLTLYFEDADDIGVLSAIETSGQTVLNCPYVYLHGYNNLSNKHYPRMLVAKRGHDYVASAAGEAPTDPSGTKVHIRTVTLTENNADPTTISWLSPTHLNAATHEYNDGDAAGNFTGEVAFTGNPGKKRKGKVKNTKHPVQPGKIIVPNQVPSPQNFVDTKLETSPKEAKKKVIKRVYPKP